MIPPQKPPKDRTPERDRRLADALRANLRRRKAGTGDGGKPAIDSKTGDKD